MSHIYFSFDFGSDEEKAQQARHKLDVWKQAFRLDKKLLYKFDREEAELFKEEEPQTEKSAKPAKTKKNSKEAEKTEAANGNVKLLIRLGFSSHEKITELRWADRIPGEDPFKTASPRAIRPADADFGKVQAQFDDLK